MMNRMESSATYAVALMRVLATAIAATALLGIFASAAQAQSVRPIEIPAERPTPTITRDVLTVAYDDGKAVSVTLINDNGNPDWEPWVSIILTPVYGRPPQENQVSFGITRYDNTARFWIWRGGYPPVIIHAEADDTTYGDVTFRIPDYGIEHTIVNDRTSLIGFARCDVPHRHGGYTCPTATNGPIGLAVVRFYDRDRGIGAIVPLRVHHGKPSYVPSYLREVGVTTVTISPWGKSVRTITFSRPGFPDVYAWFTTVRECEDWGDNSTCRRILRVGEGRYTY